MQNLECIMGNSKIENIAVQDGLLAVLDLLKLKLADNLRHMM